VAAPLVKYTFWCSLGEIYSDHTLNLTNILYILDRRQFKQLERETYHIIKLNIAINGHNRNVKLKLNALYIQYYAIILVVLAILLFLLIKVAK
jgi:hypothetical protein